MQQITIVTDNASNMLAAFMDRCCFFMLCSHCLNLVVTDMLDNAHSELETMISNCKTLVRHFKHAACTSVETDENIEAGMPHKVELSVHYAGVDRYTI